MSLAKKVFVSTSMLAILEKMVLALMAGILHHFAVQYPCQLGLYTTLYVFALLNSIFLVSSFLSSSQPLVWRMLGSLAGLVQFNVVYVVPFNLLLTSRFPSHSS